ncbi:hypothetical protein CFB52_003380 [Burkholderia sp. AU18528]|uniref:hypothetical protein n=1 Tax=Burkholderia sp. AU18528 TaxID=2015350 RepID=UPI000C06E0EC|nr:hypothetical protein [Burkholderia sp. AU18528]PHP89290.1 hypothetical protein CFB52_003380 [Burkholderia sp. AU18528]
MKPPPGAPDANRLVPVPFPHAKVARSTSAALPPREIGTTVDSQLRQALDALVGRAIAKVDAKPWSMLAKPVCESEGNPST